MIWTKLLSLLHLVVLRLRCVGVITAGWFSTRLEIETPRHVSEEASGVGESDHVSENMGSPTRAFSFDRLDDIAALEKK